MRLSVRRPYKPLKPIAGGAGRLHLLAGDAEDVYDAARAALTIRGGRGAPLTCFSQSASSSTCVRLTHLLAGVRQDIEQLAQIGASTFSLLPVHYWTRCSW